MAAGGTGRAWTSCGAPDDQDENGDGEADCEADGGGIGGCGVVSRGRHWWWRCGGDIVGRRGGTREGDGGGVGDVEPRYCESEGAVVGGHGVDEWRGTVGVMRWFCCVDWLVFLVWKTFCREGLSGQSDHSGRDWNDIATTSRVFA